MSTRCVGKTCLLVSFIVAPLPAPSPALAQELIPYESQEWAFSVGVPAAWVEEIPSEREKKRAHFLARFVDPITTDDPVARRLEVYAAASPARKKRNLAVDLREIRIAPYRSSPSEAYRFMGQQITNINGLRTLIVEGVVTDLGGTSWRRTEISFQGVKNLYALVFTYPESEGGYMESRIQLSVESMQARDAMKNPWTAWLFGMGGIVLLVVVFWRLQRWVRS
jgi:hypothetical protein